MHFGFKGATTGIAVVGLASREVRHEIRQPDGGERENNPPGKAANLRQGSPPVRGQ